MHMYDIINLQCNFQLSSLVSMLNPYENIYYVSHNYKLCFFDERKAIQGEIISCISPNQWSHADFYDNKMPSNNLA